MALAFYRVHIPCRVPRPIPYEDETVASTLYFRPELDFLFFDLEVSDTNAHNVSSFAMLYDMRVADGKGVGACNLAIDKKLLLEWAGG